MVTGLEPHGHALCWAINNSLRQTEINWDTLPDFIHKRQVERLDLLIELLELVVEKSDTASKYISDTRGEIDALRDRLKGNP